MQQRHRILHYSGWCTRLERKSTFLFLVSVTLSTWGARKPNNYHLLIENVQQACWQTPHCSSAETMHEGDLAWEGKAGTKRRITKIQRMSAHSHMLYLSLLSQIQLKAFSHPREGWWVEAQHGERPYGKQLGTTPTRPSLEVHRLDSPPQGNQFSISQKEFKKKKKRDFNLVAALETAKLGCLELS